MNEALEQLKRQPLEPTLKSLARRAAGLPLDALGSLGLSLLKGDLPFPAAVLKESALRANSEWMMDFAARSGVSLCPHGKTTMAPQLFDRQLVEGCWGITAATGSHLRTYRRFGVPRILLANQVVDRANIDLVIDELESDPELDLYVLMDSEAALDRWLRQADQRALSRPLQVLLEAGAPGGRTGVRGVDEGVALGRALRAAAPRVLLRGIEAFEGVFGGSDLPRIELRVLGMLDTVAELAAAGMRESWFAPGEVILSAGGSAFFDLAARVLNEVQGHRAIRMVLRSGCYLTHDSLFYERTQARMRQRSPGAFGTGVGLRPALEIWTVVQSVPEPTRAICAMGKRDVSHDMDLPIPLHWYRPGLHDVPQPVPAHVRVTALNDQHAYVDATGADVPWLVGDLIGFGVAHPCTTFDKWPLLHVVDEEYRVVEGIRTFF